MQTTLLLEHIKHVEIQHWYNITAQLQMPLSSEHVIRGYMKHGFKKLHNLI